MYQQGQYLLKIVLLFCLSLCKVNAISQSTCPVNIGFEQGSFENWECNLGTITRADGTISLRPSQPSSGRHTLVQNSYPQRLDFYGGFPVNCPNGSGYSIQLGNSRTGAEVERLSYTFTIPQDQNNYSIIYNYAVVFENPDHADWEQPKFTANIFDVSNDTYIGCSSFSYTASSNLPGFKESPQKQNVYYKTWTPVTIKLSGYAGRTIRLEFTTNDCSRGGHFGYAYVDVNQNCTSPVSGNVYCANTESITLTAPFGFSGYRWFTADFSKVLGSENTLLLDPVPPPNTTYAVEVIPYPDQGCLDTIYTTTIFSGSALNLKVANSVSGCISSGVNLTSGNIISGSSPGLSYAYFTDLTQTNYVPTPKFISNSGTYYIQATNSAGCTAVKKIGVTIETLPVFKVTDPQSVYRPVTVNLSKTVSSATGLIFLYSYWSDTLATKELMLPESIDKNGTYFIKASNRNAPTCSTILPVKVVIKEPVITPPNAFSPNGDGIHDDWHIPQLAYYPECYVEIYNRSGRILFRSSGYNTPWDGKYEGRNLPVATYYFVIKLNTELPPIGGSVTLIK